MEIWQSFDYQEMSGFDSVKFGADYNPVKILFQDGTDGLTVSKPLSTGSHFFRNFSNHHPTV